jgi:hypothetical protein
MSSTPNQDIDKAIASLAEAGSALAHQCEVLEQERRGLEIDRKDYLVKTAASMLPAVTKAVLADLRIAKPLFVTADIEKAFRSQRKFLGIFTRSDYSQVLNLLQSRLASHLDEGKHGDLKRSDVKIASISARLEELWGKHAHIIEIISLMQQARSRDVVLPKDLQAKVARISSIGNQGSVKKASASRRESASHAPQYSARGLDDYNDLITYVATDFPVSVRTLMLSAIDNYQAPSPASVPAASTTTQSAPVQAPTRSNVESFGGDGQSGYSSGDSIHSSGSYSNDAVIPASTVVGVGAGIAAGAVAGVAIATDDSLGRFS